MRQNGFRGHFVKRHTWTCFSALVCLGLASAQCGKKEEIIEVVEEEPGSAGSSGTAGSTSTSLNSGSKKSPTETTGTGAASDSENTSPNAVATSPSTTTPKTGTSASSDSDSSNRSSSFFSNDVPAVDWEPAEISKLVNTYCAGPCHGVHGKFESKDYFLSLKDRNIQVLTAGKMPPPGLFANFHNGAAESQLLTWLKSQ